VASEASVQVLTLVMRPCMMRKCGLLTFSCTLWNIDCTRPGCATWPLIRYLFRPPMTSCNAILKCDEALWHLAL